MNYQMFRLSLMSRQQLDLISAIPSDISRSDYLQWVFSRRIDFVHHGNEFSFVKVGEEGSAIVGRLGRKVISTEVGPPESTFAILEKEGYRAVNLFLETGPTDQRLAIQVDEAMGQPSSIVASLISAVNNLYPAAPWGIDVIPITDEVSFWQTVRRHRAEITGITFEFIAPNVLGLGSKTAQELKEAREKNRARTVRISMQNPDGIVVETEDVKEAVEYVAKGGGDVTLKSGKRTLYNSKKKVRKLRLENNEAASPDNEAFWKRALKSLFGS